MDRGPPQSSVLASFSSSCALLFGWSLLSCLPRPECLLSKSHCFHLALAGDLWTHSLANPSLLCIMWHLVYNVTSLGTSPVQFMYILANFLLFSWQKPLYAHGFGDISVYHIRKDMLLRTHGGDSSHCGIQEAKSQTEARRVLSPPMLMSSCLLLSTDSIPTGKVIHIAWWTRVYTTHWNVLLQISAALPDRWTIYEFLGLSGHLLSLMVIQVNCIHADHCYT